MFDLNDKRDKRRRVILGKAQIDARHGVLLAAMDFEWTCRRAILALSKKPTVVLYEKYIEDYSAFKGLEKAWSSEVVSAVNGAPPLSALLGDKVSWQCVKDAMQCRNAVVHGTENRVTDKECRWAVCILEDACDIVVQFAEEHNGKIFEPINRRRSKKAIEEETKGGKRLKDWHNRVEAQIAKYDERHWIKTSVIC
ncbi:MAG: hypothetical protein IJL17_23325 [Kiritimatiellae bacterium]|nr:hypothetical protein [Kiritimatiellia bacterium]